MKVTIEIHCDNAAFEDNTSGELNDILRSIGQQLVDNECYWLTPGGSDYAGGIYESNGNICGTLTIERAEA